MKSEIYDLVTEYDRKVEDILIEKIKHKYPDHKYENRYVLLIIIDWGKFLGS